MAKALVIGMGEVGEPLWKMLVKAYGANEVKARDIKPAWMNFTFEFLHICFPQNQNFIDNVVKYAQIYKPQQIILHSTVSPGMTDRIYEELLMKFGTPSAINPDIIRLSSTSPMVYFSPVNANTRDGMEWGFKTYTKYLAPSALARECPIDSAIPDRLKIRAEEIISAADHLTGAGFKVELVSNLKALEYAKLLDLCWFGVNIAFFQEVERLLDDEDYQVLKNFMTMIDEKSEGKAPRVVFYGGYIGGHCVVPAMEKILAVTDSGMLKEALISNIKRKEELTHRKPAHHPI